MDKSCGAFLVILNQVTKLYGPEMAPMALFDHPRYGGNHGDRCPKGPALGEDRLEQGQASEQSQDCQDERVPGIPHRTLVRGDAQFDTPPGIELCWRKRFGL